MEEARRSNLALECVCANISICVLLHALLQLNLALGCAREYISIASILVLCARQVVEGGVEQHVHTAVE
jgi:hypothetical protein